jgi:hypothetical protein
MALAEIRTATWLLQALRRRLESLAHVSVTAPGSQPESIPASAAQEKKIAEELRCVLAIMCFFVSEYLSEQGDGIVGLEQSFHGIRRSDWLLSEAGPLVSEKTDKFLELLNDEKKMLDAERSSAHRLLHP